MLGRRTIVAKDKLWAVNMDMVVEGGCWDVTSKEDCHKTGT